MTSLASPYVSQADIEQFAGVSSADFKQAGTQMTATQWASLCTTLSNKVSAAINRYCNVDTFFVHLATEYHDGKGCTGDWFDANEYREEDRRFYFQQQPLYASTYSSGDPQYMGVNVWVDANNESGTKYWVPFYRRGTQYIRAWEIRERFGLSYLRFHSDTPSTGRNNVKIEYYAGFATDSQEISDLKMIALKAVTENLLMLKKKIQESTTIRASGVRDFAPMFEMRGMDTSILGDNVKKELDRYKIHMVNTDFWG